MNVLRSEFFCLSMKLPSIFYELGQRNTEKCEKSNLWILRQKSTKMATVQYVKEATKNKQVHSFNDNYLLLIIRFDEKENLRLQTVWIQIVFFKKKRVKAKFWLYNFVIVLVLKSDDRWH